MCSLNSFPIKLSLLSEFFNLQESSDTKYYWKSSFEISPRSISKTLHKDSQRPRREEAKIATYFHQTIVHFKAEIKTVKLKQMQLFYFRLAGREKCVAAKKNTPTSYFNWNITSTLCVLQVLKTQKQPTSAYHMAFREP